MAITDILNASSAKHILVISDFLLFGILFAAARFLFAATLFAAAGALFAAPRFASKPG